MEKYFCNYNQSLALKELGFDEPCFGFYSVLYDLMITQTNGKKSLFELECLAPLKSQVFEWFRNEHGLNHMIDINFRTNNYITQLWRNRECLFNEHSIKTYEEAESACIDKLIELLQHDK